MYTTAVRPLQKNKSMNLIECHIDFHINSGMTRPFLMLRAKET